MRDTSRKILLSDSTPAGVLDKLEAYQGMHGPRSAVPSLCNCAAVLQPCVSQQSLILRTDAKSPCACSQRGHRFWSLPAKENCYPISVVSHLIGCGTETQADLTAIACVSEGSEGKMGSLKKCMNSVA